MLPGLEAKRTAFISPAIDPLSTKNMPLEDALFREVVGNARVDANRPLVVEVSRFDPWKDPMGVIEAYRIARRDVAGLQLALVGAIAGDDPEGWRQLLALVQKETADDDDIYVFTNLAGVGGMEVNAFQRAADLVMQFPAGFVRYLVGSFEELAARTVQLLRDPGRRQEFGAAAHEHVRSAHLLPRLLRDDLRLLLSVLDDGDAAPVLSTR